MGKPKHDPPTPNFPYKISKRLNLMSVPRPVFTIGNEGMPAISPNGVRMSAIRGPPSERVNDAALPSIRRLFLVKRLYKHMFSAERLERIDHMIELSNATPYAKLSGNVVDLKKQDAKDPKKKKGWSESEWKKHMDYISQIANPKKDYTTTPARRGERRPLAVLLPRINMMSALPHFKIYRRPSQESNYRDPGKVPPGALKYVISDRVKKLAKPKVIPTGD